MLCSAPSRTDRTGRMARPDRIPRVSGPRALLLPRSFATLRPSKPARAKRVYVARPPFWQLSRLRDGINHQHFRSRRDRAEGKSKECFFQETVAIEKHSLVFQVGCHPCKCALEGLA